MNLIKKQTKRPLLVWAVGLLVLLLAFESVIEASTAKGSGFEQLQGYVGGNVTMPCVFTTSQTTVFWRNNDSDILLKVANNQAETQSQDGKYKERVDYVQSNFTSYNYTIQLLNLTIEDERYVYNCSGNANEYIAYTLKVDDPPQDSSTRVLVGALIVLIVLAGVVLFVIYKTMKPGVQYQGARKDEEDDDGANIPMKPMLGANR